MSAQIILWEPEPPADRRETLARAQRRHCLDLLGAVFGPEYAAALAALHAAPTAAEAIVRLAELEALP